MSERAPLPSSVTQPLTGEAPTVPPSYDRPDPHKAAYARYMQTEKGKAARYRAYQRFTQSEEGRRKNREAQRRYLQTEEGRRKNREKVKRWQEKRKAIASQGTPVDVFNNRDDSD